MNTRERVRDLPNERSVEIPWLLDQTLTGPVLDVGCHDSIYLGDLTGPVDGIDLRDTRHEALRTFFQADIRTFTAPEKYPSITAISSVEHVGLAFEPYGTSADDPEGDRHAIKAIMRALAPDGTLYLTVPAHQRNSADVINYDWYRSYGREGLADLLDGYSYHATSVFNDQWKVGGVWLVLVRHRL